VVSNWVGFWKDPRSKKGKGKMNCSFEISSDGSLTGSGVDLIGHFSWSGKIEWNEVLMTKQYVGKHSVSYEGRFKNKSELEGKWVIGDTIDVEPIVGTFYLKEKV